MSPTRTSPDSANKLATRSGLFALLFLLVFAVFCPVLRGEFLLWDDDVDITANPHLNPPLGAELRWIFTDTTYMERYQPLSWLTWALLKHGFGLNPFWFHFAVLLFHALNAGLVFLVIRKLLLLASFPQENAPVPVSLCAAWAAALWALHPMRVETTAWAVELLFVQPVFFLLLSILCYLAMQNAGADRAWRWYWASLGLFIASLLSYPLAMGGFVIFAALDVFPLRRLSLDWRQWRLPAARRVLLEKVPFAIIALFIGWFNLRVRTIAGLPGRSAIHWRPAASLADFGVVPRIMQAFYVWAQNLWKPWLPLHLTPVPTQLVDFKPFDPPFLLSALLVVGLTVLLVLKRQKWPGVFVLWFCYLALLVPVLGLSEHPHFPSDRYSLLVSICWSVLLAAWFLKLWAHLLVRRILLGTLAVVICLLSMVSVRQTARWRTDDAFFHELLREQANNSTSTGRRVRSDCYRRLARDSRAKGDYATATEDFRAAIAIWPAAVTYNELGDTFLLAGDLDGADASYTAAEKAGSSLGSARNELGVAYAQHGKLDLAVAQFAAALRCQPEDSIALQYMVQALRLQGKTNEAAPYQAKLNALKSTPPANNGHPR